MSRTMKHLHSMISTRTIGNESPATGGKNGKGDGTMTDDQLAECGPPFRVFRTSFVRGYRFELREAAKAPDKTVAILYRRNGDTLNQCGAGWLKDGVWKNTRGKTLDPDNLYWCEMVKEHGA